MYTDPSSTGMLLDITKPVVTHMRLGWVTNMCELEGPIGLSNGFAYCSNGGHKMTQSKTMEYGVEYGVGDVIGMHLYFEKEEVVVEGKGKVVEEGKGKEEVKKKEGEVSASASGGVTTASVSDATEVEVQIQLDDSLDDAISVVPSEIDPREYDPTQGIHIVAELEFEMPRNRAVWGFTLSKEYIAETFGVSNFKLRLFFDRTMVKK